MGADRLDTGKIYAIIADTMPTEGRDFTMAVDDDNDGRPRLIIKPLTAVGRGFVPSLIEQLKDKMKGQDVVFSADVVVEREVKTINTIRAAIERDSLAALKANLDNVIAQQKARKDAMAREDAERGKRAITEDDVKKRRKDTTDVRHMADQQRQLQYMLAHLAEARERASKAAREAAERDMKTGVDWSVDLDAPIKSLFDERDATEKLKVLENTVQQMSAHMFMVDDLTHKAAEVGKQYIIKK